MCDLWSTDVRLYMDICNPYRTGYKNMTFFFFKELRILLNPLQIFKRTPKTPMERTHSTKLKHFPENSLLCQGLQTLCKKAKVLITEPKTNLTVPSILTLLKSKALTLRH